MDYVAARSVKRTHRSNNLSKSDAMKLAKMMADPRSGGKYSNLFPGNVGWEMP
jgi:hypothetical protein